MPRGAVDILRSWALNKGGWVPNTPLKVDVQTDREGELTGVVFSQVTVEEG